MTAPDSISITGSTCGAPETHLPSVSQALGRLRVVVAACCWAVGLAIVTQAVVWTLATCTEVRWTRPAAPTAEVVVRDAVEPGLPRSLDEAAGIDRRTTVAPIDANRVPAPAHFLLGLAAATARGVAVLATLVLLPIVALGVLLAVASATDGVDRAVAAFTWTVVLGLLVLPIGGIVGMPWRSGAVWEYAIVVEEIDAGRVSLLASAARHLLLPLAGLVCSAMVGQRFLAGVRAGLLRREHLKLDPSLEQEAANIKATSLHGGRAGAALARVGVAAAQGAARDAGVREPVDRHDAGVAPRRVI